MPIYVVEIHHHGIRIDRGRMLRRAESVIQTTHMNRWDETILQFETELSLNRNSVGASCHRTI
jgi:hypothetical protein